MSVLAGCRSAYDDYLAALARADQAVATGELDVLATAVAEADRSVAMLRALAPALAAIGRDSAPGPQRAGPLQAEMAGLADLAARARGSVESTIAALRRRQAAALAEVTALSGANGPYTDGPRAGDLVDRCG